MAGVAAEKVHPVSTCNLQTSAAPEVRPGARATGLQGSIVVPILLGDEVVGTLGVGCKGPRSFTLVEVGALYELGRALARKLAPPPAERLRAELERAAGPEGRAWVEEAIARVRTEGTTALARTFPEAARRVGRGPLGSKAALAIAELDVEVSLGGWRIDDAMRVLLVLEWAGDREAILRELYFAGDQRERTSALRALAVCGRTPAALDVVRDALRVAAVELFEAAIADNPYASRLLPIEELRAAVLKCAFVGVPLTRVEGLVARADAVLSESLLAYVAERESAGRSVPPDIWQVVACAPVPGLCA
jgi:hypothetical protein